MSIQGEEILLKQSTTGTTITFFSTHLKDAVISSGIDLEIVPTILELNNFSEPVRFYTFDGSNLWTLNNDNFYVETSAATTNFITGHSYNEKFTDVISDQKFEQIKTNFFNDISQSLSQIPTATTQPYPHREFVVLEYSDIDDFYVNIKINRTFDTLNTLNIYNNLVNSFPVQESPTGVVFGRLVAQQSIKDEQGNNIKIPLRNVPIGIFNPSDKFPDSSSVDENGDRLYLNLKESAVEQEYFNVNSFTSDTTNYLRSEPTLTNIPDQYKYITTTNENGEFIIYDAPVGTQLIVFDVDLFKQGLTKDEIALNFFPFTSSNDSFIDSIPSFSFKKFSVDVVPAWGTIQTGYTELNITTNYDLRKWVTFYIPPMAYEGNLLGSIELSQFSPSLNVDIRDMSKEGFPIKSIPIVEIQDITNKDEEQTLLWNNEFVQLKNGANFFTHGFKAFKLKANMYDPYGFRTDKDGVPNTYPSNKGVWLAGYQFKLYYNSPESIFRSTGYQRDWGYPNLGYIGRDNFHMNRGNTEELANSKPETKVQGPPYDKPWTHLYPNKYSIPRKPSELNYNRITGEGRLVGYLEQPEYKDGDLVGLSVNSPNPPINLNEESGGYAVQYSPSNKRWFSNRFSKEVTKGYIYKYEAGVAWNETYANGYEPSNPGYQVQPGASRVVGGEKFQRVECGYGYWLRPGGWPVVSAEPWGDAIFSPTTVGFTPYTVALNTTNGNNMVKANPIFVDTYNIENKEIALALDNKATFREGPLEIYRIIDPNALIPEGPDVIPTYARFNFGNIFYQKDINNSKRLDSAIDNSGNDNDNMFASVSENGQAQENYNLLKIRITNNGEFSVNIPNTNIKIEPRNSYVFNATELSLDGSSIVLPGNSNFDFSDSKYLNANYSMQLQNIQFTNTNRTPYSRDILGTNQLATAEIPTYYMITTAGAIRTQYDGESCENGNNTNRPGGSQSKWEHNIKMNGLFFGIQGTSGGGTINDHLFQSTPINKTCGGFGYNDGVVSIPIEVI